MKPRQFKNGDVMGAGLVFIKEVEPRIYRNGTSNRVALFKCPQCGGEGELILTLVRCGHTKTCGCSKLKIGDRARTHGLTKHPVYRVYHHIKERCYNPNVTNYKHYGGRGIIICEEWRNDFMSFYNYVTSLPSYDEKRLKRGGSDYISLDRENNDGNYEPDNMRWVSQHVQRINQRNTRGSLSGYVGVTPNNNKFESNIFVHGERIYLGLYASKEEAVGARNNYIIKHGLWEYPIQAVPDYLIY